MNGADGRFFQMLQGIFNIRPLRGCGDGIARPIEFLTPTTVVLNWFAAIER